MDVNSLSYFQYLEEEIVTANPVSQSLPQEADSFETLCKEFRDTFLRLIELEKSEILKATPEKFSVEVEWIRKRAQKFVKILGQVVQLAPGETIELEYAGLFASSILETLKKNPWGHGSWFDLLSVTIDKFEVNYVMKPYSNCKQRLHIIINTKFFVKISKNSERKIQLNKSNIM